MHKSAERRKVRKSPPLPVLAVRARHSYSNSEKMPFQCTMLFALASCINSHNGSGLLWTYAHFCTLKAQRLANSRNVQKAVSGHASSYLENFLVGHQCCCNHPSLQVCRCLVQVVAQLPALLALLGLGAAFCLQRGCLLAFPVSKPLLEVFGRP